MKVSSMQQYSCVQRPLGHFVKSVALLTTQLPVHFSGTQTRPSSNETAPPPGESVAQPGVVSVAGRLAQYSSFD